MGKLFGTNGVRGVFSEDFTLEFVHDLMLAISTYFKDGTILVGYDGRDSSSVISKVVCSTLNSRWTRLSSCWSCSYPLLGICN